MPPTRPPDEYQLTARRHVGARIRERRLHLGLSQERLGELTGLDRRTIGQCELGATPVSIDSLTAIARALNVETWRLFHG